MNLLDPVACECGWRGALGDCWAPEAQTCPFCLSTERWVEDMTVRAQSALRVLVEQERIVGDHLPPFTAEKLHDWSYLTAHGPFPEDPGHRGHLLEMLRYASGLPTLAVVFSAAMNKGQAEGWALQERDNCVPFAGYDFATEFEALVDGLEELIREAK